MLANTTVDRDSGKKRRNTDQGEADLEKISKLEQDNSVASWLNGCGSKERRYALERFSPAAESESVITRTTTM